MQTLFLKTSQKVSLLCRFNMKLVSHEYVTDMAILIIEHDVCGLYFFKEMFKTYIPLEKGYSNRV